MDTFCHEHLDAFIESLKNVQCDFKSEPVQLTCWLDHFVKKLSVIQNKRGSIYFLGNGASASMASHFSTDFSKNGRVSAFTLHDGPMLTCFSNDYSYETAFLEMLKRVFKKEDLLVAISSSGNSANIINATNYAREINAEGIMTFSGFSADNSLRKLGNLNLWINHCDYGMVESAHSYFLHLVIDKFCTIQK